LVRVHFSDSQLRERAHRGGGENRRLASFRPQLKEQRAFQNEIVALTGAAQPEENALKPVLDEDQSEIHVALAR
jgi:hypothetical protein